MFGLLSVDCLLNHPVCPQALCRAADHARDGGAAGDLKSEHQGRGFSPQIFILHLPSWNLNYWTSSYLATAAGFIALCQALLLGGAQVLPWLDEVAKCDVHGPVSLQFAYSGGNVWNASWKLGMDQWNHHPIPPPPARLSLLCDLSFNHKNHFAKWKINFMILHDGPVDQLFLHKDFSCIKAGNVLAST